MNTDWNRVREMMNAAIDTCERIEAAGYDENTRDAVTQVNGQAVSAHDFVVSAWTLPENVRYAIIRARHEAGNDLAYVPETARILVAMAQAAAETIGAGDTSPPGDEISRMIRWFTDHASPGIEQALGCRESSAA